MIWRIVQIFKGKGAKSELHGEEEMKTNLKVEEIKQMVTDLAVKTVDTGPLTSEVKMELKKVAEACELLRHKWRSVS